MTSESPAKRYGRSVSVMHDGQETLQKCTSNSPPQSLKAAFIVGRVKNLETQVFRIFVSVYILTKRVHM